MVMFFEWHPTAMDQTSRSGLSLSGEETDLEALSSPLVGYLGKVQKRAASLEHCPWCTSKGLTFALRSYRLSLHESIPVCTNPQCLFPLVSRSLEDVLAGLVPVDHPVGSKQKNTFALGREEPIEPDHKRKRLNDNVAGTLLKQAEQAAPGASAGQQTCSSRADAERVHGCHGEPLPVELGSEAPAVEDIVLDNGPEQAPCSTEAFNLLPSSYLPEQQQPVPQDLLDVGRALPELCPHGGAPRVSEGGHVSGGPREALDLHGAAVASGSFKAGAQAPLGQAALPAHKHLEVQPDPEDEASVEELKSSDLLPLPGQLFWSNSENLCWLDSLLVALVNCKSLRRCRPAVEPQRAPVWRLLRDYEDICSAVRGPQPSDEVSPDVLQKTNGALQRLRMSVFKQLQPKLHCKLGQEETPVFALPLLLAMDSWAEPLFQSVLLWELRCAECSAATTERVRKTLATFTDVVPDWLPLHAVHLAPCNSCCRKQQRRTMTPESLPPVFALHFVQGLPDNDVGKLSFSFAGKRYCVTTVIQYRQQHFVPWICSHGVWLEYDDLKHPEWKTHGKLQIPAEEMHIVFWEVEVEEEEEGPATCSHLDISHSPEQSLVMPHNDTAIVCALSAPGDATHVVDPTAADTSIGSTTLLDTFEGLSHDDIITFTLVDITADLDVQPVTDRGPVPSCSAPTPSGTRASTADRPSAEPPTTSVCPKVNQHARLEATHVTGEAIRESGGCDGTRGGKEADLSKMDPGFLPPTCNPTEPPQASPRTPQQASPVSPRGNLPVAITQKATQDIPSSFETRRWSYLLSKNPQFSNKKPEEKSAPVPLHMHSTPQPVQRPGGPGGPAPKVQLRMEDGSLPLKAAAMYNSFGIKSPVAPKAAPPLSSSFPCPVPPKLHGASQKPPSLETMDYMDIVSSRGGSRSSKTPPCLNHTDALRYKLIKKLKAKKKKLAKLNEMLGHPGPDSTNLNSPSSVSSSTFDGTVGGSFLLDLLSPATTASNLSPDSTSFLDMIATGQEGGAPLDEGGAAASHVNACRSEPSIQNFLDDFLSQVASQRPTDMETEALSALDLFV